DLHVDFYEYERSYRCEQPGNLAHVNPQTHGEMEQFVYRYRYFFGGYVLSSWQLHGRRHCLRRSHRYGRWVVGDPLQPDGYRVVIFSVFLSGFRKGDVDVGDFDASLFSDHGAIDRYTGGRGFGRIATDTPHRIDWASCGLHRVLLFLGGRILSIVFGARKTQNFGGR